MSTGGVGWDPRSGTGRVTGVPDVLFPAVRSPSPPIPTDGVDLDREGVLRQARERQEEPLEAEQHCEKYRVIGVPDPREVEIEFKDVGVPSSLQVTLVCPVTIPTSQETWPREGRRERPGLPGYGLWEEGIRTLCTFIRNIRGDRTLAPGRAYEGLRG